MAPTMESVTNSVLAALFEYDTPRIVHIKSKKVGVINRLLQLTILGYIIGYAIVYEKGYQDTENVQSAVTTKVKGIDFSSADPNSSHSMMRTWDVADYVIPPQENNAFFVMTNVIVTPNQSQTTCPESTEVTAALCKDDSDCMKLGNNTLMPGGNGVITGKCVQSDIPGDDRKVCEIYGWCPLEYDHLSSDKPVLSRAENFTVFIKNNIEFPKFNVARRNLPTKENDTYLKQCLYNGGDARDKNCPIFRLGTITEGAGFAFEEVALEGGVMQIVIDWSCNLDYSEDDCVPDYTFRRLDKGDYSLSKGFNFRYADRYMLPVTTDNGTTEYVMYRTLYKAYGIRFLVTVEGKAGKFNIVPLLLNLGSGLALLGVSTVICDIVVLYFLKAKHFYRDKKYLEVKEQDAYVVLEEDQPELCESPAAKRRTGGKASPTEADGGSTA